jgi:regulator of replication initiation timing
MADKEAQQIDALHREVLDLERKVNGIKPVVISLVPKNAPLSSEPKAEASAPAEDYKPQIADLSARIDELRHQIEALRNDLEARKADKENLAKLEQRVAALEAKPEPVKEEKKAEVAPAPAPSTVTVVVASAPSPAPAPVAPAPAPVVEVAPVVAEAPVSEEEDEEDGDNKLHIIRRSFSEKMLTASVDTIDNYNHLRNFLVSYKDISSRVSFPCDSYRGHRKLYAKIICCQKSLKLYLALSLKDYKDSAIPLEDASDKKAYEEVPCLLRIKSPLSVRRAEKLIADMLTKEGFAQKKDGPGSEDFAREIRDQGRLEATQRQKEALAATGGTQ